MSSIAYRIAQKRVLVVEEMVEAWQIDREEAQQAGDVNQLVNETAELLAPIERVVALLNKTTPAEANADTHVVAHAVGHLIGKAVSLYAKVALLAAEVERLGYVVEGRGQFDSARAQVNALESAFVGQWLLPDRATVETAKRQMSSGMCRVL